MSNFTIIEELKIILDIHRKNAFVTCPQDCLCWDVESYIAGVEAKAEREANMPCPHCGKLVEAVIQFSLR